MRTALAALIASTTLLTASATPVPTETEGRLVVALGSDCAVIAAVARDHYRFNDSDNVPPPLWMDDEGSGWAPGCDWSRYGLSFPSTHDPERVPARGEGIRWVSFKQPRYDGEGALIESGIKHGPLAGMGVECRVVSGFNGWIAVDCRST